MKLRAGIEIPKLEIDTQTTRDRERVLRYIAPSPELVEKTRLLLRSMLATGPMGYGKTSFIEAKLGEAAKRLLDLGVDERQVGYVYAQERPLRETLAAVAGWESLPRLRYLYLFIDDAPAAEGLHGRRAMTRENVAESQAITMIRHKLKAAGYEGYVFIAWASQVYHLVDITVRRTSALKVFKDYPEEDDARLIARMLGAAGMQALALISDWLASDDPRLFLYGVYTGVAKMKRRRWLITAFDCPGFPNCDIDLGELERQVNERKAFLARVERLEAGGGKEEEEGEKVCLDTTEWLAFKDVVHVAKRLLEEAELVKKGADYMVRFNEPRRLWLRARMIQSLEQYGIRIPSAAGRRNRETPKD